MAFKCPKCGTATLFHVDKVGEVYLLKCYKTRKCGWQKELVEYH